MQSLLPDWHRFSNKKFYLMRAFTVIVISVQEVSKESQDLMRKALEEVHFAFCSFVVVILFLFFCSCLSPLSFFLSWLVMGTTNWGDGQTVKFEI